MFRSDKNTTTFTGLGLPNPAAYELGSPESRAAARALLDVKLSQERQNRCRLAVCVIGRPLSLATSTCKCSTWPDGTVFEFVTLDGSEPTEAQRDELDKLIRKIPIDDKTHMFAEVMGND